MTPSTTPGPASAGPVFDIAARITAALTGAALVALVCLVAGEAFLRGAFDHSLGYAEELTGYLVVFLTFFGAALALRAGSLFRVEFLLDAMSPVARRRLTRILGVAALILARCWPGRPRTPR